MVVLSFRRILEFLKPSTSVWTTGYYPVHQQSKNPNGVEVDDDGAITRGDLVQCSFFLTFLSFNVFVLREGYHGTTSVHEFLLAYDGCHI